MRTFVFAMAAVLALPAPSWSEGRTWNTYTAQQLLQLYELGPSGKDMLTAYVVGVADGERQMELISRTHPDAQPRDTVACIPNEVAAEQLRDIAVSMLLQMKSTPKVELSELPSWIPVQLSFIQHWPCASRTAK